MATQTTCQICGRAIKLVRGTIAHHGYRRREGYGQTRSCYGTRFHPYEIACDAIERYAGEVRRHMADTENAMRDITLEPPHQLARHIRRGGFIVNTVMVPRPEPFRHDENSIAVRSPDSYAYLLDKRLRELRGAIAEDEAELAYLAERLAKWKLAHGGADFVKVSSLALCDEKQK